MHGLRIELRITEPQSVVMTTLLSMPDYTKNQT